MANVFRKEEVRSGKVMLNGLVRKQSLGPCPTCHEKSAPSIQMLRASLPCASLLLPKCSIWLLPSRRSFVRLQRARSSPIAFLP